VDEIAALVAADDGRQVVYQNEGAFFSAFPERGYTLTLYVGSDERFAPAQFLVLSRVDGVGEGQLMIPNPGGERSASETFRGAALDAYLARVELDLSALDEVAVTHYGVPPAAAGE